MQEITHGALFSGSGGFELAARMCGINSIWASEIEPFPIKVTKARFPEMEHVGDIGIVDGAKLPPVDIISGGSPCQDMSIAGRRQGLKGERSVLFMDYIRIVKEMRKKHGKPRFMVWENVPGAFSSNKGEDFRCVLEEIAGIAEPGVSIPKPPKGKWKSAGGILGDGYSVAWRVLDAQYWGIPQRRKRIFLVADFGGESAGEILFKREGLSRNITEGREKREETPGKTESRTGVSGEVGGSTARPKTMRIRCGCEGGGKGPLVQEDKSGTLSCHNDQTVFVPKVKEVIALENHPADSRVKLSEDGKVQTLTSRMGTGGNNVPLLMESRSTAYGICSMDSNAMKSGNPDSGFYEAKTSRTLDCKGGNPTCNQGGIVIVDEKRPAYAIQGNMIGKEEQNGPNGKGISEDVSFTLTARDRHAVAYAIGRDYVTVHEDVAQTLTAELFPGSVAQPYSIGNGQANSISLDEKAGTLNCMHDQQAVMVPNEDVEYVVRRFTPLECGRLQGFPDDWTEGIGDEEPGKKEVQFWQDAWAEWWALIGRAKGVKRPKDEKAVRRWMKNPASDTELYKMWGNGIALPCALYVFEGIALQINSGDSPGSNESFNQEKGERSV